MILTKFYWKFAYFMYPYVRDFTLFTRVVKHGGRQKYHLGYIKRSLSVDDFYFHLEKQGFEHSILSWIDDGEILSLRKRVDKKFQYHIRLFQDGEVRGHYEYSPESQPLAHYFEYMFVPGDEYFKKVLKGLLKK
jgi:hypothetical protein